MADEPKKNNNKIGALWKKKTNEGKVFLSGVVEYSEEFVEKLKKEKKVFITVFNNGYKKEGDKKPDFEINLSKPKPAAEAPLAEDEVPF